MTELSLKYGLNPHQKPARVYREDSLPLTVESGRPGYINLMDALNGWQLAREMKRVANRPAAASFKHVSPAGAAVAHEVVVGEHSPLCQAYLLARNCDPTSSFGDFIALSDVCDEDTANVIRREVSDGVIAPGYTAQALKILRAKRGGAYCTLRVDPDYEPEPVERRQIFGVTFEAGRNDISIEHSLLDNIVSQSASVPDRAATDLLLSLVILKYTQSNSVCCVKDGQAIGVGAGQQSRIHCTRLACDKADKWWLRRHPTVMTLPFRKGLSRPDRNNAIDLYLVGETLDPAWFDGAVPEPLTRDAREEWLSKLDGVSMGSDAFFPFSDSIERARRSGVRYVAEPGGSKRDGDVIAACDKHGMTLCFTGTRLFHH
ncbi:MAG: phosphoribosylaminoimidazolecarboxamide formyltransferase [Oscillospiraceae bacterium]|jgi:AICAR transformylase/IMP cyclohydrolase PurH|nr:phosphoribosylaminoimidazolecarboxamide formyltransferase [Oscillospiraceae bacterium]